MNIIKWWNICRKNGHHWVFDSDSLTGEWIVCHNCYKIDEYIPGVHEPKGYKDR
jgi:hypothetical protein